MKKQFIFILLMISTQCFACGGGWDMGYFYSIFSQTNIADENYYPFLRDDYNTFYGEWVYDEETDNEKKSYPKGNLKQWQELLPNWTMHQLENRIYEEGDLTAKSNMTALEKNALTYINFARECSEAVADRINYDTWNYDELLRYPSIPSDALIEKASIQLKDIHNEQLRLRYYYQIIRLLHYDKKWEDAVQFYESTIKDKYNKSEIYYYIVDQVAGCYYSTKQYDQAAYLFTKVINNSKDRKESAFLSYNFCTQNDAEGKPFFKGKEDEKDFLFIQSLHDFSDKIVNIEKFIQYDANDKRIELLFMRKLNALEELGLPRYLGFDKGQLPSIEPSFKKDVAALKSISKRQYDKTKNKDFWSLSTSYLSFLHGDINQAQNWLNKVSSFKEQKKQLQSIYTVYSWENVTAENEKSLTKIFEEKGFNGRYSFEEKDNWLNLIREYVAHRYYKDNQIAKAFLLHNTLESMNGLSSLELIESLESFNNKSPKSSFETLIYTQNGGDESFMDYLQYQKGIYYLQNKNPAQALVHFERNASYEGSMSLSKTIFSNNLKECFDCPVNDVMDDLVYQAKMFNFIKDEFNKKELAKYLLELENLTHSESNNEANLALYLLGNYYFNVSNTGYYRGALIDESNCCHYGYMGSYAPDEVAEDFLETKQGYNLMDLTNYNMTYFDMSTQSMKYYQKIVDNSKNRELVARTLYLMAKCELNTFYNNDEKGGFSIKINDYYNIDLPEYDNFKILKEDYKDTKFHDMILQECSYFRLYSDRF